MAYGTINADLMTTSDGVSSSGLYGFKNRIINGAMVIDQRNAGASVTNTTSNLYTLDRWACLGSQSSKFTIQQNANSITPPVGFVNYLGCTSSSAYTVGSGDYFQINQIIEGYNIADLGWGTANAKTITLSAWVYSSLTGTFGGALRNSGSARCYPFIYTISSANTWTQVSITIVGDTSGTWLTTNGHGIQVVFSLGMGSTYSGTAGVWASSNYASATGAVSVVGTNGATFYITGVMLEKGSTATSFDYRPYSAELAMCQRYYQRSNLFRSGSYYASSATTVRSGAYQFVATMRAAPSITFTSTSFNNASGISTDGIEVSHFQTYCNTLGAGAFTWEAVIQASAEL
jgi:hypothetical protein